MSPPPKNASTPPAAAGIPPETVAIIAAAVSAFAGASVKIISIKPMNPSWERAGRQSVFVSHRIR
jgi:hypothetical protein